jgi:uncharacterized protein (DUF433 family)
LRIYFPEDRNIYGATVLDLFVATSEAAFIADVSDREMNRAVDEHILPEPLIRSDNGRRFARLGAALASFYFTSEDVYAAALRRKVVEEVSAILRLRKDMESILALRSGSLKDFDWRINVSGVSIGVVSVDIGSFVSKAMGRMRAIERAQKLIAVDPEILGGTPVFAGTRVPVDTVSASLKKGIDRKRILRAYPSLTDEHLDAARVYSEVYPRRGRPTKSSSAPPSWKIKSSRHVSRHDTKV